MRINGKQKEKYGRMTWNSVPSSTVQVFCLVARECNCYAKHRSCFIYSSFCTFPSVSRKAGAGTGVFQKKKERRGIQNCSNRFKQKSAGSLDVIIFVSLSLLSISRSRRSFLLYSCCGILYLCPPSLNDLNYFASICRW